MNQKQFNTDFFDFLLNCPTAFHTSTFMAKRLKDNGFIPLLEYSNWQLKPGNGYFCIRDDGSIIGFRLADDPDLLPWRMTGAHTDSPGLQIKPNPIRSSHSLSQLCVEVYGGPLLTTWFDRNLGIAGLVTLLNKQGDIQSHTLDFKRPMAILPSLAIHLDRNANKEHTVTKQKQLHPILCHALSEEQSFNDLLCEQIRIEYPNIEPIQLLDHELFCYDTQGPSFLGASKEFISAGRLDNLVSCFIGLAALLEKKNKGNCLLLCSNHEEIGSSSFAGANGNFLSSFFERILPDSTTRHRSMSQSYFISMDNAHALHPNFTEKHDPQHLPLLNQGPVLKYNSNQRYASTSRSAALFKTLCSEVDIPVQSFVMNNDLACGSTIGPIAATTLGIHTVDVGVPSLAMHSIRETTGSQDPYMLYQAIAHFYAKPQLPRTFS